MLGNMDLTGYRKHCVSRAGYRDPTFRNYIAKLKEYAAFTNTFSKQTFNEFLDHKKFNNKIQNASINVYIRAVRSYGEWAGWEWVDEIKYWVEASPEETSTEIMSDEEIEAFWDLPCPPRHVKAVWDKWTLFFKILGLTGMRPGEVAKMTVNRVDFGTNNFILRSENVKTKRPRRIPIPPNIKGELKEYVAGCDKYLFPSSNQSSKPHIHSRAWIRAFNKRVEILGIKREGIVSTSLRHSYITNLLGEGVGLKQVQKLVGQKRIETTARYTHLVNKDSQKAILKHRLIRKATMPKEMIKQVESAIDLFELEDDERFDYSKVMEAKKLLWESVKS